MALLALGEEGLAICDLSCVHTQEPEGNVGLSTAGMEEIRKRKAGDLAKGEPIKEK